jgi:hypothetical protein
MTVGLIGMLDISILTDRLLAIINDRFDTGPLPLGGLVHATGLAPHTLADDSEDRVSLYLFHVARDPHQLNVPLNGPYQRDTPPPRRLYEVPFLPLGLELYYLLTAYSAQDYRLEQKAMSAAMTALHENPVVHTAVPLDGQTVDEEFTVTMGVEGSDELSRLWQATTAPLRLSAVYRVGAVFLAPQAVTDTTAPQVKRVDVVAEPGDLPLDPLGDVSGTSVETGFAHPDGTAQTYELAPAVVQPGDTFLLHGAGLDQPTAAFLILHPPAGTALDVTAWASERTRTIARLTVPAGGAPPPGVYRLGVSDVAPGGSPSHTSRLTPFSIAARIDPGAGTALLTATGGVYHVAGEGFIDGETEVLLGAAALSQAAAPPAAGTFAIEPGGTTLDFARPAALAAGRYPVRVRVSGIESRPAWWVDA